MKLIDRETGTIVTEIITNHSMSIDVALDLEGLTVAEDGQIMAGEKGICAKYDNLEMCYSTIGHWDVESWGVEVPPENVYELINQANDIIDVFHVQHGFDADLTREFSNDLWEQYCRAGKIEALQKNEGVRYFIKRGDLYFKDFMGGETPNGLAKWTNYKNEACAFDTEAKAKFIKNGIIPYNGNGISIVAEGVKKRPSLREKLNNARGVKANSQKRSSPKKEECL